MTPQRRSSRACSMPMVSTGADHNRAKRGTSASIRVDSEARSRGYLTASSTGALDICPYDSPHVLAESINDTEHCPLQVHSVLRVAPDIV